MKKPRHEHIDLIRGLSIIAMIVIHINAYFRAIPLAATMWDLAQFAVVGFVFCSAYVYSDRPSHTIREFLRYYQKRSMRLLRPYFVFLFFYFTTLWFIAPRLVTTTSVLQNVLLIGGLDLNWMVLLFVQLSFLMPFLSFLKSRVVVLYLAYATGALGASLWFLLHDFAQYKLVMWLPWSLLVVVAWWLRDRKKKLVPLAILLTVSLISFEWSRSFLVNHSLSLLQYANKYPPNLYHLAYGMICITLLYIVGRYAMRYLSSIKKQIFFFSTHSYTLFFIHFWFLLFFDRYGYIQKMGRWTSLVVIFALSVGTQHLFNYANRLRR